MPATDCQGFDDPQHCGYLAQDGTRIMADELSLESTHIMGKLSCDRAGYYMHISFCWCVFLTGIGAMVSRVWTPAKWTHKWWGRAYGMFMLWATGSSMIIHNSGLPLFTLKLFLVLMIFLPLGWYVILLHQSNMQRDAIASVQDEIRGDDSAGIQDLDAALVAAKQHAAQKKSCRQRFLSLKALHGFTMVISWFCIAGRIPVSDLSGDFTCHTYPVYKPINADHYKTKGMDLAGQPLKLLPLKDPNWVGKPWDESGPFGGDTAFTLSYLAMSAVICIGVGVYFSWRGGQQVLGTYSQMAVSTSKTGRSSLSVPLASVADSEQSS